VTRDWLAHKRFFPTRPYSEALAIGLVFLALYVATATPGFVVGWVAENDSAEIQRAVVHLGVIHSTGYPLYTLLAFLFTRIGVLFGGDPFTWVTYFSAFTSAAAVALAYLTFRTWFEPAAALFTASILGVSGVVWHIATIAEVQGLHLLIVVAIVYLTVRFYQHPKQVITLEMIALLFGAGLANHRTIVLIAPAVGLVVLSRYPWRELGLWGHVRLVVMFGAPLLAYFYIFYSAAGTSLLGETPTIYGLGSVYDHFDSPYKVLQLVMDYGQMDVFQFPSTVTEARHQLYAVLDQHVASLTWLGMGLSLIGLLVFARRQPLFFTAFALALGILWFFFMAWRIEKKAIYYGPSVFLLCAGLGALTDQALRHMPQLRERLPRVLPVIVVLAGLAVGLFAVQFGDNNRSGDHQGDTMYRAFMAMEPGSVFFSGGWGPEHFIGLEALRHRDGLRVEYFDPINRAEQEAQNPDTYVYIGYRLQVNTGMIAGATPFPEAGLALAGTATDFVLVHPHVDARVASEAHTAQVVDQAVVPGIRLYSYRAALTDDGIHLTLYWQADQPITATYRPFTHLRQVDAAGNVVALLAQRDYPNPVHNFYPTRFWQTGEVVRDTYVIPWPDRDPPPKESLRLSFGFTDENGQRLGDVTVPFADAGSAAQDG
jgi:hypothetical protein